MDASVNPQSWNVQEVLFALAISAVPISIAFSEFALAGSLLIRLATLSRRRGRLCLPRVFWFWLVWAALELALWLDSPPLRMGWGEIRHLALIFAMFLLAPTLDRSKCRTAWRGVIGAATLSSLFLIGRFVSRMFSYHGRLDPMIYFRDGGLVHHWMIYGTIEIIVLAGLLQFRQFYPQERWWQIPVLLVNAVAIVLSLTRMLWICSLFLLLIYLAWRRSRWTFAVPLVPFVAFLLAPGVVRLRVTESIHPDYYSNSERMQMLRVGLAMIRQHPVTGVGPGRVEALYTTYLSQSDPIPAYHGHLHNNLVQLAAEFGLPVTAAALVFVAILFWELRQRYRSATDLDGRFLSSAALLGMCGFLASGMFDYTYGHSLGLILLCFAVFAPVARIRA